VICVNAALKGAPRCDFWSAWDNPNDIHEAVFPDFVRLRPELATDKSRAHHWIKWWETRGVPRDLFPSIRTPVYGPLWFKVAAKSPLFTTFASMSFAIQEGATHIHLLGCDMGGTRYFDEQVSSLQRVTKRPARVWNARWERERGMMARVIKAGKANGIAFSGVDLALLPDV
jgi:hypothetical protein